MSVVWHILAPNLPNWAVCGQLVLAESKQGQKKTEAMIVLWVVIQLRQICHMQAESIILYDCYVIRLLTNCSSGALVSCVEDVTDERVSGIIHASYS